MAAPKYKSPFKRFRVRLNSLVSDYRNGGGKIYEGKSLSLSIESALNENLSPDELNDRRYRKSVIRDIKWCFLIYGTTPHDYFLFDFHRNNKSFRSRNSFVTDSCKDHALIKYDGWSKYLELSNKFAVYKRLSYYFGREVMMLNQQTTFESFCDFAKRVSSLFIKPISSSYGKGAMVYDVDDEEKSLSLYKNLTENANESWIVEERIIQDERMAVWNHSSVNTIRFTSILNNGKYHILTPVLRTGRSGSIVDNGGSGGILSNIDPEKGIIYTDGVDEHGHTYTSHPDSNVVFRGWEIPQWRELITFARDVHCSMSDHKYVGWDFALSNKGWVLIEGNWGQFLNQYVDKVGRKKEFFKYVK